MFRAPFGRPADAGLPQAAALDISRKKFYCHSERYFSGGRAADSDEK
jgi:hypothetical protein